MFPPVSVDWFLALCACIGTCSAIGYGAFMLLVPFLHDGCNSSFRNGFAFSGRAVPTSLTRVPHGASVDSMLLCCPGVVNLLFSQATGFSNALKTSTSSNRYWDCAGAIAIVGIAAGVYILTQYVHHAWPDGPQRLLPVMMASCVQVVCGCGSEQTNRQRAGRAAYTWTQAAVAWRCVEGRVALCAGDHAVLWGWDVGVRALHVPPNSGRAAMSDGGMKSCA